jgi:hypothetical protein
MSTETVPRRDHATSKATRLLSAGTYLDPLYRKSVIKELLTNRFRVVAPSYGYDAVSVLAHALAAHRLRRNQLLALGGGTLAILVLTVSGVVGFAFAPLLFVWLVWATAYLRRIATLQTLMTRLKEHPGSEFDGSYPTTRQLTEGLVRKVDHEQSSGSGTVFYGRYHPFVGAGQLVHEWSSAELLLGAPVGALERSASRAAAMAVGGMEIAPGFDELIDGEPRERKDVIPFTVAELTSYVAARMTADLYDDAPEDERIKSLTVERRRYARAIRELKKTKRRVWSLVPAYDELPDVHWDDEYDSAREYLCVRVGSWNQELVTSIFVGFDIKGNTLHTEFYTYALAPLIESFHLVDRLPDSLNGRLMWRVAWDVAKGAPRDLVRLLVNPLRERLPRRLRKGRFLVETAPVVDYSEFRLGRYVTTTANCGARTSVREMATNRTFHHFFQESDTVKYTQIVERRLLQIIRDFLFEHNVDLDDHDAQQGSILNQHFGDNNNFGSGNLSVGNVGRQSLNSNSKAPVEKRKG